MCRRLVTFVLILVVSPVAAGADVAPPPPNQTELARDVSRLVRRLDDDRIAQREAAEQELLALAGTSTAQSDAFLKLLPQPTPEMPVAVRDCLSRIRAQVEARVAKASVAATRVTFSARNMPLAEVLTTIEKQTGNKASEQQPDDTPGIAINTEFTDEPYWSAIDLILDQARLSVYSYGGDNALSLVPRPDGEGPRFGRAVYSGPFRLEVIDVQAQRSLRAPANQALRLQLEIAWEPRLSPIAISQPVAALQAIDENGQPIAVAQPEAVLDVEVPHGTQATELILPLALPPRSVTRIATLKGKLTALVPGRIVEFRFDDVPKAIGKTQRQAGVQVTIDDVRKNNAIWEVHMRLRLDEDNRALESHRGWVFQNLSYLIGKDGAHIDNAGFETTRQTPNEVGIAYLFDVEGDLEGLTWVYETPGAIVELPVEYELSDIELP